MYFSLAVPLLYFYLDVQSTPVPDDTDRPTVLEQSSISVPPMTTLGRGKHFQSPVEIIPYVLILSQTLKSHPTAGNC